MLVVVFHPDVAVLDIGLPEMRCYELVKPVNLDRLREIVASGGHREGDPLKVRSNGGTRFHK